MEQSLAQLMFRWRVCDPTQVLGADAILFESLTYDGEIQSKQ